MPSDERPTKVAERCQVHPGRSAIARCAECDRPLCVQCAVPVRGRVLGPECLRNALGDEAPPEPAPKRPRKPATELVAGAAFAGAGAMTLFPWTRFATGSGFAGAWASDLRWSMLAATAAMAALVSWGASHRVGRLALRAQVVFGFAGAVGAAMSLVHPPPFKHASIEPAFALVLLLAGATAALLRAREPSDLHR
ncbi:MAG: B-box zinc finger protein [Actinomycetota bacterium]